MGQGVFLFNGLNTQSVAKLVTNHAIGVDELYSNLLVVQAGLQNTYQQQTPLAIAIDQFIGAYERHQDLAPFRAFLGLALCIPQAEAAWTKMMTEMSHGHWSTLSTHRFADPETFHLTIQQALGKGTAQHDVAATSGASTYAPDKKKEQSYSPPLVTPRPLEEIIGEGNFQGINIRSPEEARLVLEFFVTGDSNKGTLLKRASQEALKYNIPISWVSDPTEATSYTRRETDEVLDWETKPALKHGIFLRPHGGIVEGETLFHELAHALPQKFVAGLFPDIPWGTYPTPTDDYPDAVYKILLRMSMQEAYAFELSHDESVSLLEGEYLGENHVVLYTFGAALQEAKRLKKGEPPNSWAEPHSKDFSVEMMRRLRAGYEELGPLSVKVQDNALDPLSGYFRKLSHLLHKVFAESDLREIKAQPFTQDAPQASPLVDAANLAGGKDLIPILETHTRTARQFANVSALTGKEDLLVTLSFLIPPRERGRFWGAAQGILGWDLTALRSYNVLAGLDSIGPLLIQGFVTEALRILNLIFNPQVLAMGEEDNVDKIFRDNFPPLIQNLSMAIAHVSHFGSKEAVQAYLGVVENQLARDFFQVYKHWVLTWIERDINELTPAERTELLALEEKPFLKVLGQLVTKYGWMFDAAFQKNFVDPYLINRPGLEFFLSLSQARKYLLDRGFTQEALQIENMMRNLAPSLVEKERVRWQKLHQLSAANLRELAAISPELGGGWEQVAAIFESITQDEKSVEALSEVVESSPDLPTIPDSVRARFATIWAEGIDRVEGALADGDVEWIKFALAGRDVELPGVESALDRLRIEGSKKDTGGLHWPLGQSLKLYRFAGTQDVKNQARYRIETEAMTRKGELRGVIWDAYLSFSDSTGNLAFQLGTDTNLFWIEVLLDERRLDEAIEAIEKGISQVPPFYRAGYAPLLYRLRNFISASDSVLDPRIDSALGVIRESLLEASSADWKRHHYLVGKRKETTQRHLFQQYQARLDRDRFLGLVEAKASQDIQAILGQASIYDALLPGDWIEAAHRLDIAHADSQLVAALYARGIDAAEMKGEVKLEWAPYLDWIDHSKALTQKQKDTLFVQIVDVLFVLARSYLVSGLSVGSASIFFGGKTEKEKDFAKFHEVWERVRQGGYVEAQTKLLKGVRELQEEMAAKDTLGAMVLLNPFVRQVTYACGDSCVSSPFVRSVLGKSHALGDTLFGESDYLPLSINLFEHEGSSHSALLSKMDPKSIPDKDMILGYRYLAYNKLEQNKDTIKIDWETRIAEWDFEDLAITELMAHFGVDSLEEFFEKNPFVAGTFFFKGFHPLVRRSTVIARQVLLLGKGIPTEVLGMALECLARQGQVSPYVWNHYLMAKESGNPERVLQWRRRLQEQEIGWFPWSQFNNPVFYPDSLMIPLLEKTGNREDQLWREFLRRNMGKEGFEEIVPIILKPYLEIFDLYREPGPWSNEIRSEQMERVLMGDPKTAWLEDRSYALSPSAGVILPKAFDKVDPRLRLLIRLFLAGLEPSVRRHILHKLALVGETRPEYVLQRLVELVNLPGLGQLMANLPGSVIPDDYRNALRASLEEVPPSSESEIRELAKRIYGEKDYQKRFAKATFKPLAAGKAGEVWEVQEPGQAPIVLKLIPDGKRRRAALSMRSLSTWAERVSFLPDLFKGVSVPQTLGRFNDRLQNEMDGTIEKAHLKMFETVAAKEGLVIPQVRFAARNGLEMNKLELVGIKDLDTPSLVALDLATGKTIAKALVHHNVMYTDPHAGQMKGSKWVNKSGVKKIKPTLLDFGQMLKVSDPFLEYLYGLVFGVVLQNEEKAKQALRGLIQFETAQLSQRAIFEKEVGKIISQDSLPSQKIESLLDAAAAQGGTVSWEFSEFIRMVLYWEGAMQENKAPHYNFIETYLVPELTQRFGAQNKRNSNSQGLKKGGGAQGKLKAGNDKKHDPLPKK